MSQETLERELARRADRVHGVPLSLDDVRGKAVSIRRRRRAAVTGAVAAAVALAVVVPTLLSGGTGSGTDAPEPAGPVPGHTAVLHDGALTLPDGGTVTLDVDNADVTQVGLLTDGRIVLATQRPYAVQVYAPDGALDEQFDVETNVITMSPNDDAVAWVGQDRGVRVLSSGTAEPVVLPGIPSPGESWGGVDAVLGPDRVLAGDGTTTTGELGPDGFEELSPPEDFRVLDVSPDGDLWAVAFIPTAEHEQYGCSGLYDPETDAIVARRCDTPGLEFSPDGEHLLSLIGDNNMYGEALILDRDLDVAWRWQSPGGGDVISRAAWSDSENLLAAFVNWQTSSWSLQRVDVTDESVDAVVTDEPGRNPETIAEFQFSE